MILFALTDKITEFIASVICSGVKRLRISPAIGTSGTQVYSPNTVFAINVAVLNQRSRVYLCFDWEEDKLHNRNLTFKL